MNNIKIKLNEGNETVNEVQLKDLYLSATKALQTLLNLNNMAMSFSNARIKRKSQSLNSMAFELLKEIEKVMDNSDVDVDTASMLDQDKSEQKVIESVEPGVQPNINESAQKAIHTIMHTLNLTKDDAKSLFEAYVFPGSEDKEEDKEEIKENNSLEESLNEEEDLDAGDMDLSEAFELVKDDELNESDFEAFQEKIQESVKRFPGLLESVNKMDKFQINSMMNVIYDYADANSITVKIK